GYLEQAEAGIRNGLARGDRSRLFLYRADTTDYERLRRAFARDARARRVIDELQATDE
ncbi:MAG: hypothetical protein GWN07_36155, partial [Actinobacteria bacterium]|nr:hypothetical protein [Actinomycetota bacterium]NIX24948.1 hypothetical protein [Actinomycetota bacterium]